jgi:hypothetical protein
MRELVEHETGAKESGGLVFSLVSGLKRPGHRPFEERWGGMESDLAMDAGLTAGREGLTIGL